MTEALEHQECVHVSPFILHNLNADFDGDTVTLLVLRGVESTLETRECMREPLLYGAKARYTFSQSLVHRIFLRLCLMTTDDVGDVGQIRADEKTKSAKKNGGGEETFVTVTWPNGVAAKRELSRLLDIGDVREPATGRAFKARKRAFALFGAHWYNFYVATVREHASYDYTDWRIPIWRRPILDIMFSRIARAQGRRRADDFLAHCLRAVANAESAPWSVELLSRDILCAKNWTIVHSGAKSTPTTLVELHDRHESFLLNAHGSKDPSNALDVTTADRLTQCYRYNRDFIEISRNVPQFAYFESGIKYALQRLRISDDTLYSGERPLLSRVSHYLRHINGDFFG